MLRSRPSLYAQIAAALLAGGLGSTHATAALSGHTGFESVGPPAGFEELARPREVVLDVYFGGQKLGNAIATVQPGYLQFREPQAVATLVPNAADRARLTAAFSGDLATNSALVCTEANANACGVLTPEVAGIIFDEQHFRVDLFVNPQFLKVAAPADPYLKAPALPPSLTSSVGFAASGTTKSSPIYNFQNRTIFAFRNVRLRADTSYASGLGFLVDDFVAEVDRPNLRYSAGLFWAPGLDLIGQRRIVGLGVGTQFDTRTDRETLQGTPLVLFLNQPARVEILIDGRLVASRLYAAGNDVVDTSTLPDGAYSLVLRIREASGAVREERRFFTKNAQIAPVGKPLYFAFAGLLANTRRNMPISFSKDLYYQFGTARRLNRFLAVDLSAIGTQRRSMLEAGAWLLTSAARIRVAALASTSRDRAALLQIGSASLGGLSFNFDLRRVWSHDGQPLIPAPDYVDNFGSGPPVKAQLGVGSYTQATASLGYQFGAALFSLIASYRKDQLARSDYSIGPSVQWLLVNRPGLQLSFEADAQRTRSTRSAFFGITILHTGRPFSTFSTTGYRDIHSSGAGTPERSRVVTSVTGQYYREDEDRTQVSLDGGFERSTDFTSVHGNASFYSRFGTLRADLLNNVGGPLQYGLNLQAGAAIDPHDFALGGRDLQESALVATIEGSAAGARFDVLIDEQPYGQVTQGDRLPIFLQPYHLYKVRLRPIGGPDVWYDSVTRDITLYPGMVQHLSWHVERLATLFGRAVRRDGTPIANASIQARRGVGETDDNGYFQVDSSSGDTLVFTAADGTSCRAQVGDLKAGASYIPMGKMICE